MGDKPATFDLESVLNEIERAKSGFDVFQQLKTTARAFGLPYFLVKTLASEETPSDFNRRVIITNWDSELLGQSVETGLFDRANFAQALRVSPFPMIVRYSEIADDEPAEVRDHLRTLIEAGHEVSACFPIRLPKQAPGTVWFTGAGPQPSATDMAMLAYVAWRAYAYLESADEPRHGNPLTRREIDVLQEVSRGLTAEEIGVKLGITSHTVNYHIANTVHKLRAKNKIHALVTALRQDLLDGQAAS